MNPVEPFGAQPLPRHALNTTILLLRSPRFRSLPLMNQRSYLSDLQDPSVTNDELAELIEINDRRFAEKSQKNQLSNLDILSYNAFEALVSRGEIQGRDLLLWCESSETVNAHCDRGFTELHTGKRLHEYIFRKLLKAEFGIDYGRGDHLSMATFRDSDAEYLTIGVLATTELEAATIGPRECYDLLTDTFTWVELFKYIIGASFLRHYLMPNLDPQLICTYIIANKRVQSELSWVRSNNGSSGVMAAKLANGTYVVDVFQRVHGENSQLDYDDPLYQHIIGENKEHFNLLLARFINVRRVLYGIPQSDPERFSWAPGYIDKKNARRGKPAFYGNTVLLDIGGRYLYIQGNRIGMFYTPSGEPVLEYYSYLANNSIPMGYALTQNYILCIFEGTIIPRSIIPKDMDWHNNFVEYYYENLSELQEGLLQYMDAYGIYNHLAWGDISIDWKVLDRL